MVLGKHKLYPKLKVGIFSYYRKGETPNLGNSSSQELHPLFSLSACDGPWQTVLLAGYEIVNFIV